MTPLEELLVEQAAKAFCEGAGPYKWDDTAGTLREWYLRGARAAVLAVLGPDEGESESDDDKDKGWR